MDMRLEGGGGPITQLIGGWILFLITTGPPVAIVALVVYLIKRARTKKCPFCVMSIPQEAIICRFCGREVGR